MNCPACSLKLDAPATACPRCRADLSLLSGLQNSVSALLSKADALRSDGQLAPAVQAYLEVLEVDPANSQARAALGPVLRALRAPRPPLGGALIMVSGAAIAALAFAAGYWVAR